MDQGHHGGSGASPLVTIVWDDSRPPQPVAPAGEAELSISGGAARDAAMPDAGAIRLWSTLAVGEAMRRTGWSYAHPATIAEVRELFLRYVGALPYRFRSAGTGEVITVPDLDQWGHPIFVRDGQRLA